MSRSLAQRIRNRFNVAVSEVADQDRWQTLSLGVACVSDNARYVNEVLSKIVNFVEDHAGSAVLADTRIEILRT